MKDTLNLFCQGSLYDASVALLKRLSIGVSQKTARPMTADSVFKNFMTKQLAEALDAINDIYYIGAVTDDTLANIQSELSADEEAEKSEEQRYKTMIVFAMDAKTDISLTRTVIATLTRSLNRRFNAMPIVLLIRQGQLLSLATCERMQYTQAWRNGEKLGKVNILRDINCSEPHRGHLDILNSLESKGLTKFEHLYNLWMSQFDISALNTQFYTELQNWFYWATDEIVLPDYRNTTQTKDQMNKNFIVRMLSRLMFCWFLKEKYDKVGNTVIDSKLLELKNYATNRYYPIINNIGSDSFLQSSSYYRGILQNVFFCGLNSNTKRSPKDFKCKTYLPDDFDYNVFIRIPFLNGSTFRPLDEDFFKESIEDDVMSIPNSLFYGDATHRGINEIFHDYKFTVEENTPNDVDIALDPEMLGMVFENLLAEIDPNNEDMAKSIRKATGSFYTPRPVIQEMTNESLSHYLFTNLKGEDNELPIKEYLADLIYKGKKATDAYDRKIVEALHYIRILDPACGSGAFPMGMLQRIVDILRIVDPNSDTWLELMLQPIDDMAVREQFRKQLSGSRSDYQRKLGIIRNCIYAIDIQPIAVQITKLRFFISLLADQEIDTTLPNSGILPFPNMETKIVCADSLKNIQADFFVDKVKNELIEARQKYYQPNISPAERERIADDIADILDEAFPTFAVQIGLKPVSNKAVLKRWFIDANLNAPFFDMGTFFPEINDGFDIVIGNPPYGGFKIAQEVRQALALGSNDPYGAFIARFLGNGSRITPLKDGGMLAFIVSDTFMTIGSHLDLRKQMMHNRIHKMIRMSPKTFSATVNTVTIFCEKCKDIKYLDEHGTERKRMDIDGNVCTMADMTNIDIHEDFTHFVEVLSQSMSMESDECIANEEYAIYRYPQTLILNCSNLPFFVANPKLFVLMCDGNEVHKQNVVINDQNATQRIIYINDKNVRLYRLGDIASTYQGLATADNKAYLYQNPNARGGYRDINLYKDKILTDEDLLIIQSNEETRKAVISNGISKDNNDTNRFFGGRYIVRYDKGGESDIDGGWMPNYFVPSDYYIDWSSWAVERMKTLTIAERIKINGERKPITEKNKKQIAAVIRNPQTYFLPTVSFSCVGVYAPSFRIGTIGPYDHDASAIVFDNMDITFAIAICSSKIVRYLIKTMVNHTVYFGVEDVKNIPIISNDIEGLKELVNIIIEHQKKYSKYDYASHEQLEIDRLVYEAYGLNEDDIREVETWYARRYPKLADAQRRNLEKVRRGEA